MCDRDRDWMDDPEAEKGGMQVMMAAAAAAVVLEEDLDVRLVRVRVC